MRFFDIHALVLEDCTAGGATSFLTLSLYLVERTFGPEAARAASRFFLIDPNKSPQSAYAIFGTQKMHGDEGILRAQEAIEEQLSSDVSRDVGYGDVVAFRRLFQRWTGLTPSDYRARYGPRTAPTFIQRAAAGR